MRLFHVPKCYIEIGSPEGLGDGNYTVEQLMAGRNCEQLVDIITRCRELYPSQNSEGDEQGEENDEEGTGKERAARRARETERMAKHVQRISTPIPRTPSPGPDLSLHPSTTGGTSEKLAVAKFSSLSTIKAHRLVARQVSSKSSSSHKLLLARGGTPRDITVWSSPPPPAAASAQRTQRTQTEKRTPRQHVPPRTTSRPTSRPRTPSSSPPSSRPVVIEIRRTPLPPLTRRGTPPSHNRSRSRSRSRRGTTQTQAGPGTHHRDMQPSIPPSHSRSRITQAETRHQPSTPPPHIIPSTPPTPGAPGALDSPLWYPASEASVSDVKYGHSYKARR